MKPMFVQLLHDISIFVNFSTEIKALPHKSYFSFDT